MPPTLSLNKKPKTSPNLTSYGRRLFTEVFVSASPASNHRLAELGEQGWLRRVARWFATDSRRLVLGIGDDAAAIAIDRGEGPLVATVDALVEGVHFRREWTPARALGHKTLAVNLSDLAAMGARPLAALLALGVPPTASLAELRDFFIGLRTAGRAFGCPLAGGDLTRAPQWTISLTALGLPAARRGGQGVLARRSTARPGMTLYVTGWPGESAGGLLALRRGLQAPRLIARHNRPTPRLAEGAVLARVCQNLAMLDLSDGIVCDARRLAEASGCAIEIDAAALPISRPLTSWCRAQSIDPLEPILFGGEDYELLLATDRTAATLARDFARAGVKTPLTAIGRIVEGRGLRVLDARGRPLPLVDRTFRHF